MTFYFYVTLVTIKLNVFSFFNVVKIYNHWTVGNSLCLLKRCNLFGFWKYQFNSYISWQQKMCLYRYSLQIHL